MSQDAPPPPPLRPSASGLTAPLALVHPSEVERIKTLGSSASDPTAILLRLPRITSDMAVALARSMRVSRNGLLNALIARAMIDLIRDQHLDLDVLSLQPYLDPSIEVPKARKRS